MSHKKKSNLLVNLEYYGFIAGATLVRATPFTLAVKLTYWLMRFGIQLSPKHQNRIIQHIKHANITTGEPKVIKQFYKKHLFHLASIFVEIICIDRYINEENFRDSISLSGDEKIKDLFFGEEPAQAIIVTAHFGNWEIAGVGYSLYSRKALTTIYRPFDNPRIAEYLSTKRQCYNHTICPKKGAMKSLIKALRNGSSVCIVADQHAGNNEGVETVFMGQPASTHISPAMLHLKTGIPILVAVPKRLPGNFKFEFVLSEPICFTATGDKENDIQVLTQLYTDVLEELIKQEPEQWIWAHRRWLNINRKKKKQEAK